MGRFIDLSGQRFGKLYVLNYEKTNNRRQAIFKCKCDCGNIAFVVGSRLKNNYTKSCGCLQKEKAKTQIQEFNNKGLRSKGNSKHNMRHTELYKHWCNMKRRCNCKTNHNYMYYGARGIKVCNEWNESFVEFKEWALNNGYKDGLSIERIDVNKNYEPQNCKWIPYELQIRNRRNTIKLEYKNETKTLIEWCEIFKVKYKLAHSRYKKGWTFEKIFEI
jgi:hypothetical protein